MNNNTEQRTDEKSAQRTPQKNKYFYLVTISAFLGAILLWFYAIGYDSTIFERKINNVPVVVIGTQELHANTQYSLVDELNLQITVTVTGRRSIIYGLDADDLEATVDVSQINTAGEKVLPIAVKTPNGVGLKELSSDSVTVFLDNTLSKTIPIVVSFSDYVLADGLEIRETTVNPYSLTIDGPQSELDKIDNAYVTLSLGNINDSISAYGQITLKYRNGELVKNKYIRLSKQDVHVFIEVIKNKRLPIEVVFTGGAFDISDANITYSHSTIPISGTVSTIDGIDSFKIEIDETSYDFRDSITITTDLYQYFPQGIVVEGDNMISATIKIPGVVLKSYDIPVSSIEVINRPEEFEFEDTKLTVKIMGLKKTLSDITAEDIFALLDAEQLQEINGKREGEVTVTIADYFYGSYIWGNYSVKIKD